MTLRVSLKESAKTGSREWGDQQSLVCSDKRFICISSLNLPRILWKRISDRYYHYSCSNMSLVTCPRSCTACMWVDLRFEPGQPGSGAYKTALALKHTRAGKEFRDCLLISQIQRQDQDREGKLFKVTRIGC